MSKKRRGNEKLIFTMSRKRALELGLVFCACGHPDNNHFSHEGRPCAHCDCKGYGAEVSRQGVALKVKWS